MKRSLTGNYLLQCFTVRFHLSPLSPLTATVCCKPCLFWNICTFTFFLYKLPVHVWEKIFAWFLCIIVETSDPINRLTKLLTKQRNTFFTFFCVFFVMFSIFVAYILHYCSLFFFFFSEIHVMFGPSHFSLFCHHLRCILRFENGFNMFSGFKPQYFSLRTCILRSGLF